MRYCYRRFIALALLLPLSQLLSGPVRASTVEASTLPCPARTVCDHALGVALTPAPGWLRLASPQAPPHVIVLATRPTSGLDYTIQLQIAPWGRTAGRGDVAAAKAGADRLIDGFRRGLRVSRTPVHYGGTPGVLIRGLPPTPGPSVDIVLAHAGAVYLITAPGSSLAPDQRAALASLRFIPRSGPFPSGNAAAPTGTRSTRVIPLLLRITPNPIHLGQPLIVTLIGLHPREMIIFQSAPTRQGGFGGGLMGRHRAGPAGTIRFTYPPFARKWEVGRWRITASRAHGGVVASALVRVVTGRIGPPAAVGR